MFCIFCGGVLSIHCPCWCCDHCCCRLQIVRQLNRINFYRWADFVAKCSQLKYIKNILSRLKYKSIPISVVPSSLLFRFSLGSQSRKKETGEDVNSGITAFTCNIWHRFLPSLSISTFLFSLLTGPKLFFSYGILGAGRRIWIQIRASNTCI